jgi:hypothetical protein
VDWKNNGKKERGAVKGKEEKQQSMRAVEARCAVGTMGRDRIYSSAD